MKYTLAILAATLFAALPVRAQEPEVLVEIDRDTVYEGESVRYGVTLNHVENPSPPELKGFDDFEVEKLGERSLDSSMTVTINGRTRATVRRGRLYVYQLTPKRTGELTIPAPSATVEGKTLFGNALSLLVKPIDEQDTVRMQISTDHQTVYPMQEFTVTLTVMVKGLPGELRDRDPMAIRRQPPVLSIPWGRDDHLPEGLKPVKTLEQWLSPLVNASGAGFGINNLQRDVLSLFGQRTLTFHVEPRRILLNNAQGNPTEYWEYKYERAFVATLIGPYRLGPVTLDGWFASQQIGPRGLEGERIYAIARPVTVTVKDPPLEGRPAWYSGAIGSFQLDAELAPRRAKVGDPMTLTLTLSGKGTLESITAPDLTKVDAIAGQFKIYDATEDAKADQKTFTYALRPEKEGTKAFPAVPLAYFDVDSERYVTLRTAPIPIEVTQAEQLTGDQIVAASRPAAGSSEVRTRREGVFANITDLSAVADQSVRPARWMWGLASLAALYAAVTVVTVRVKRVTGDKALLRRRGAIAKARSRLREATATLQAGNPTGAVDRLSGALVGLVADVADLSEAGLTPREVCGQLAGFGIDDALNSRVGTFLETCDAARYGASHTTPEQLAKDAGQLLDDLIHALKTRKLFR